MKIIEDRIYSTYKARLAAEKRLRNSGHAWDVAQFSLASALVIVSILFLTVGADTDALQAWFVVLSLLSLIVSLVVHFRDYSRRASDMFWNYRSLQELASEVERLRATDAEISISNIRDLVARYNRLLDSSENHSSMDYHRRDERVPGLLMLLLHRIIPWLLPIVLSVVAVLIAMYGVVFSLLN